MASPPHLKRKQPSSQPYGRGGVIMGSPSSGSCSPSPGGDDNFGLSPLAPTPRDGRKRRKDKLITWVKHTLTPYFDGHLWRKYGQKTIKDAPYPRLYFRCSYREDRHCLASKLVQQVTNDYPPLYEVTYMYEHTCNAVPIPAHDVGDAEPPAASGSELVLTFGSSGDGNHHRCAGSSRQLQGQQKNNLPAVLSSSPFFMMKFDGSKNCSKLQAFPSHVPPPPPPAPSWSPSFPIIESSSAPLPLTSCPASFSIIKSSSLTQPSTDDEEGDMFSTMDWDSLLYDLDDQLHFSDRVQFPCNTYNIDYDF